MYDAIVIGSGIGGLSAAKLLARIAGKRVLVLEKHTEPGGQTHTFRRDGASWDVGVHYIGQVGPGSQLRAYFDYLSDGELAWNRLPDAYDRFVYPGIDFSASSNPVEYQQKLIDTFPTEARAIRCYFRDIRSANRWVTLGFAKNMVPRPIAPLLHGIQRISGRTALGTTEHYLKKHFRSPELRALLASQWGDYGLPPSRSAFAKHALIVDHYLNGGWFPAGGSARIARTFEKGIEQAGGAVRVAQDVQEILVENGRAVGVRVLDRRGPVTQERIHRAPVVISNAGAPVTFFNLLPTDGPVGAATAALRDAIRRIGTGTSAVTVYLGLRDDPRSIGGTGGNVWVSRDLNHDDLPSQSDALLSGTPRNAFVSFSSVKSGETHHTAEIISFVDADAFAAWRNTPRGNRGADYSALKRRIGSSLIDLAETAIPGLKDLVDYVEVSTPLTVEHYTSHPQGAFYGLPSTPERYRFSFGPVTPVEGLYLSGQDAGSCGVAGAMMGGVVAACQILGPKGFMEIRAAIDSGPATESSSEWPLPEGKHRATLVTKQRLTDSIWEVCFEVDEEVGDWAPGQFARIHVGNDAWRDYSIAGIEGNQVRFLISTRTGGQGSRFVETAEPGTRTTIELPLGQFTATPSDRRRVFVATGTGLAPFLPIFTAPERKHDDLLIFGCRTSEDDLPSLLPDPMPTVLRCISREDVDGALHGRVTDALETLDFDPAETEFYLCGSSAMVADGMALLERRDAKHLFTEPY